MVLETAAPWKKGVVDKEESLVGPPGEEKATKMRRLHLVVPRIEVKTLEEAMNAEMDKIDARNTRS